MVDALPTGVAALALLDRAAELTMRVDERLSEMRRFYAASAHGRAVLGRVAARP